jgi:hypothetical protein
MTTDTNNHRLDSFEPHPVDVALTTPALPTLEEERTYRTAIRRIWWFGNCQRQVDQEPLTEQDLDAIQKRADEATPGPWHWTHKACNEEIAEREKERGRKPKWRNKWIFRLQGSPRDDAWDKVIAELNWESVKGSEIAQSHPAPVDCTFIAHARTDVPRLLAEVRRLREENARLRGTMSQP